MILMFCTLLSQVRKTCNYGSGPGMVRSTTHLLPAAPMISLILGLHKLPPLSRAVPSGVRSSHTYVHVGSGMLIWLAPGGMSCKGLVLLTLGS